jgi:tripartite-type tricarboxylate transporter receptor subunit TctC
VRAFEGPTNATANVATGRVKVIATAAETRNASMPGVPTLRELGYDVGRWGYNGFFGPPGMAPAVVDAVHGHIARALNRPDVRDVLEKVGNEVVALPPAEMTAVLKRMHEYWGKVIPELRVRLD